MTYFVVILKSLSVASRFDDLAQFVRDVDVDIIFIDEDSLRERI